jgi:hypothetical protein
MRASPCVQLGQASGYSVNQGSVVLDDVDTAAELPAESNQ